MQFPDTDSNPRTSKNQRARLRLRYLMIRAAMKLTGEASVRALANAIGMNHATLLYHIKRGECSANVATKIEDIVGREHTPNEWLRRPLDVVPDGKAD